MASFGQMSFLLRRWQKKDPGNTQATNAFLSLLQQARDKYAGRKKPFESGEEEEEEEFACEMDQLLWSMSQTMMGFPTPRALGLSSTVSHTRHMLHADTLRDVMLKKAHAVHLPPRYLDEKTIGRLALEVTLFADRARRQVPPPHRLQSFVSLLKPRAAEAISRLVEIASYASAEPIVGTVSPSESKCLLARLCFMAEGFRPTERWNPEHASEYHGLLTKTIQRYKSVSGVCSPPRQGRRRRRSPRRPRPTSCSTFFSSGIDLSAFRDETFRELEWMARGMPFSGGEDVRDEAMRCLTDFVRHSYAPYLQDVAVKRQEMGLPPLTAYQLSDAHHAVMGAIRSQGVDARHPYFFSSNFRDCAWEKGTFLRHLERVFAEATKSLLLLLVE